MGRLISKVIEWGIVLAVAGQLKGATLAMIKHAAGTHQHGLISLGALNRALMAPQEKRDQKSHRVVNGHPVPERKN